MVDRIGIEQFEQAYGPLPSVSVRGHQYTSEIEMRIIAALMNHVAAEEVVEVGTAEGCTAAAVLAACPRITDWLGYDVEGPRIADTPERIGHLCDDERYLVIRRNAEWHHVPECDAVYVDGSHVYENCKADSLAALVNASRLVIWHDYQGTEEGVNRVVDELATTRRIIHVIGSRLAFCIL